MKFLQQGLLHLVLLPPANEVWGKLIFLHLFVILFTGGAYMVAPRGRAWLLRGVCMVAWGGMHGCSGGVCMVALGVYVVAPGGCLVASRGACMVAPGGACMVAPGGHVWLLWGGMHGCSRGAMHGCSGGCAWLLGGGHASDMTRYGDAINDRAVRILLECILV